MDRSDKHTSPTSPPWWTWLIELVIVVNYAEEPVSTHFHR